MAERLGLTFVEVDTDSPMSMANLEKVVMDEVKEYRKIT